MKQKEIILEQLEALGFELHELEDLGYAFRYEDLNYLYMPDEDDEHCLRLAIPHLFEMTDENREMVLNAMQETALRVKYAKVCIVFEDAVWAMYEHRLSSTDDLAELLEHMIRVLQASASELYRKILSEATTRAAEESEAISDEKLEIELQKLFENIENE